MPQKNNETKKTQMDSIVAHSIRDLISKVNTYNEQHIDNPILSDDIVGSFKENETFIILYYK